MKIAVSSAGSTLEAGIDERFGRCACFLVVDSETMNFQAIDNSGRSAKHGAGIVSAQRLVDEQVEMVLTGRCGPKALRVLEAAGIQVKTGMNGTVRDALAQFKCE